LRRARPDSARRVVVGGFAGVTLARALHRSLPRHWEIVLYSRATTCRFPPQAKCQSTQLERIARPMSQSG